jgi:hypothetical protein
MQIGTLTELAGLAIVALVTLRAAAGICSVAGRSLRTARLNREKIETVENLTAKALKRIKTERPSHDLSWNGKRKFQIVCREYENANKDVSSFYLAPYDRRPIPSYQPGQFLTFELPIPGQPDPVVRCYSLSDSPARVQQHYRVTIKRLAPPPGAPPSTPPGLSSSFFHEHLAEGAIVDVFSPAGEFRLAEESERPVVLVAGGVGLTPLISMLNWLVATGSRREIWLFYGVRNRGEHAMYGQLDRIRRENRNVQIVVFYAEPTRACRKGVDYHIEGFVNVEVMKRLLKAGNYEFYVCGPPPMMDKITSDLAAWGVPPQDIKTESFGPAAGPNAAEQLPPSEPEPGAETYHVVFARSRKSLRWSKSAGTLLEFAEANGVKARYNCRGGICGTCKTGLREGEVDYLRKPEKDPGKGACLMCISQPKSDLVLDI